MVEKVRKKGNRRRLQAWRRRQLGRREGMKAAKSRAGEGEVMQKVQCKMAQQKR